MSMSKTKNILLETTATYQPLSDLNVRFWSQDKNTAELRFIITRNQFPLSLSKENVKVIIALESGSSFISSDDFIIDSEVEGVARYIIPTDFMRVASNVTGQVYVTTLDKEEIIVERQFKFTVSNDLLNDYPSEDKLRYIKTFDDLRNEIASRVSKLESDMETMEDYVVQVQDTTQKGLAALNDLISKKLKEYNDNHADKLALINNTVDGYVQDFLDQRSYIDTKYAEFQTAVGGSGLVTVGDAESWQKYKMVRDNGTRTYIKKGSFNNVLNLATGFYETVVNGSPSVQGFPESISDSAFVEVDIMKTDNDRMQVKVVQSSNSRTFIKNIHTDGADIIGWKEVAFIDTNDPYETVSGSQNKANTAENNAKVYADSKVDEQHNILFSGSVNGVGQTVNLTGNMNDYEYIIISGDCAGNDFSQIMVPSIVGSVFNIQNLNLRDSDGMFLTAYEVRLETTSTTIKITNDVSYDNPSDTGSGPNRNAYTILRVEGVMKK